jgi:hypothetical protein
VFWERFEDAVKVSSAPTEAVAVLIPHYPWNEHEVDNIEALWPQKFLFGFGNVEAPRGKFFPEVIDLGEEEVNVSFLHNGD